ncbi:S-adenosyl-L-methionine-dependent methyltransferase [Xylariaceae sp. FL0255]|nr:S-adenosyl-L-methionine-dependent methyltransferase [Xylariaceae sp. FL0255]
MEDTSSNKKPSISGDQAPRPKTASSLSFYSKSDQQTELSSPERRRADLRPLSFSSSSQSGTHHEWDPASASYYATRTFASTDDDDEELPTPTDFWPRSDSEDDTGDEASGRSLKRTGTAKSSGTARFIKSIMQKFGRSYNKGYDFLPNDAQEKDRNSLQHNILLKMLDGKVYISPVTQLRTVLDLGCGPGNWPLEVARRNPNASVLGIDLEPVKPPFQLPNCHFRVADFTKEWNYEFKFDLIHLRHLGALPSKDVLTSIYDNLNPGGWAEFTEWIVYIQSTDSSITDSSMHRWWRYWQLGLEKVGTSSYYPLKYKRALIETGFKNVTERKYAVPMNPWPPGKSLQKIGALMETNIGIILEVMSMPIFAGVLGWSPDAVSGLVAEVRKEISNRNTHTFMTLLVVYAQKPRASSSSGSSLRSTEPG